MASEVNHTHDSLVYIYLFILFYGKILQVFLILCMTLKIVAENNYSKIFGFCLLHCSVHRNLDVCSSPAKLWQIWYLVFCSSTDHMSPLATRLYSISY